MKKNRNILIISSIIALSILVLDIVLASLATLQFFAIMLIIIFIAAIICLFVFILKKNFLKQSIKTPLENIEYTIQLKLEDLNINKFTPIRNDTQIEIIDDTSIKTDLEFSREQNITKEIIENELSKTLFINDLKQKMIEYEKIQAEETKLQEIKEQEELNKLINERRNEK